MEVGVGGGGLTVAVGCRHSREAVVRGRRRAYYPAASSMMHLWAVKVMICPWLMMS